MDSNSASDQATGTVWVLEFGAPSLGSAIDVARQCVEAGRAVPDVNQSGRCGYELVSGDYGFVERLAGRTRADGYDAILSKR